MTGKEGDPRIHVKISHYERSLHMSWGLPLSPPEVYRTSVKISSFPWHTCSLDGYKCQDVSTIKGTSVLAKANR